MYKVFIMNNSFYILNYLKYIYKICFNNLYYVIYSRTIELEATSGVSFIKLSVDFILKV